MIGYPTGGDNTSITSGVVSRVEVTLYVHAASHLMAIQIDAAINPGRSGWCAGVGAGVGGGEWWCQEPERVPPLTASSMSYAPETLRPSRLMQ